MLIDPLAALRAGVFVVVLTICALSGVASQHPENSRSREEVNRLFPVILVLDQRRRLANTARPWTAVPIFNVLGALGFAALMVLASTIDHSTRTSPEHPGVHAAHGTWIHVFWAGIAGGWIIALVAWLITASRFTISQIALIWLLASVIAAAHLAHCIAGSAEILSTLRAGRLSAGRDQQLAERTLDEAEPHTRLLATTPLGGRIAEGGTR